MGRGHQLALVFWVHALMGFLCIDNVLIVGGRDGLRCLMIVVDALTRCQGFLHACLTHAPLLPSFVSEQCSQEPSVGVSNGMLAVHSMLLVPYVCVHETVYVSVNEKWEEGPPMLLL